MIKKTEMMQVLIEACPNFSPAYDLFLAEWKDEPEKPEYLAFVDFSRYLISLLEIGDTQLLNKAFEAIERLHIDGDPQVRESATIGIIESLQNSNLHTKTNPSQFVEFLHPISLEYWQKVEDFWESGTIIKED